LGQALLRPKTHLGIKYTLFLLGIPLSPFVVIYTWIIKSLLDYFSKTGTLSIKVPGKGNVVTDTHIEKDTSTPINPETKTLPVVELKIGEYTFNQVEQSLSKENHVSVLDPKSMQVLSYLIEQQPRIVSLEELHNNVWQSQIVTDTAVRRVISKLRQAFNDKDTKNPEYIKSIMKRGYQLIAEVKTQPIE
jgi:DNA-binding winged helix-turn-helix (wHTH) protein